MSIDAQKLLEKGMKYQDWELIEEAQALLAAQDDRGPKNIYIPPQTPVEKETEQIIAKGEELKQHENGEFGMDIRNVDPKKRADGGTNMRVEQIDTKRIGAFNQFEDDLSECLQETKAKQAELSDGKTLYTGRIRGVRKPHSRLITTECTDCKKEFQVAPIHVRKVDGEERFICEKCIIKKGTSSHRM